MSNTRQTSDDKVSSGSKICDQCRRTDVEEVELRDGIYFFKGTLCPKHAAEWREHFEGIVRRRDAEKDREKDKRS